MRGGPQFIVALAVAAATALAVLLVGGDPSAAILALVGAIAAVLLAASISGSHVAAAQGAGEDGSAAIDALLDAVDDPIVVIERTRITRANRAARALLGEHILGEDVRLAIRHPAAGERLADDGGASDGAIELVGLGGRDQHWLLSVRDAGDGRRLLHLSDVTESRAADRIRVDFVANASHELRTPLAALIGFIETLREGAGDDPAIRDRFLGVMDVEARRMQRLVEDLMSLSRIEAEKYRVPDTVIDLTGLAREVCEELSASDSERGRDLMLDLIEGADVSGDRAQLSQLLHNLAGNAMKYGRAGTPVTIAIAPAGTMIALSVTDEGEGIPPEHLPRLTERFYRVDPGRSRAIGGTGLGLAIVKHIVERHRGRLEIDSAVGRGTTVSVLLPAAAVIKA
jgi:two-component system phosphate regulon sensor histidine kinase PhoR